jgi:hypothetical protein
LEKKVSTQTRRKAGQKKEHGWLVSTESSGQPDGSNIHSCGTTLKVARLILEHRINIERPDEGGNGKKRICFVPFCPTCEEIPSDGYYNEHQGLVIHSQVITSSVAS